MNKCFLLFGMIPFFIHCESTIGQAVKDVGNVIEEPFKSSSNSSSHFSGSAFYILEDYTRICKTAEEARKNACTDGVSMIKGELLSIENPSTSNDVQSVSMTTGNEKFNGYVSSKRVGETPDVTVINQFKVDLGRQIPTNKRIEPIDQYTSDFLNSSYRFQNKKLVIEIALETMKEREVSNEGDSFYYTFPLSMTDNSPSSTLFSFQNEKFIQLKQSGKIKYSCSAKFCDSIWVVANLQTDPAEVVSPKDGTVRRLPWFKVETYVDRFGVWNSDQ